jgi:mRNA interferase HicA
MKRKELEKKLRKAGCYLKREGASHSLWINPQTGVIEAVPRHTEIKRIFSTKNSQKPECPIVRCRRHCLAVRRYLVGCVFAADQSLYKKPKLTIRNF